MTPERWKALKGATWFRQEQDEVTRYVESLRGGAFQECAECAAKPGSPTLCAECLRRREEATEMDVTVTVDARGVAVSKADSVIGPRLRMASDAIAALVVWTDPSRLEPDFVPVAQEILDAVVPSDETVMAALRQYLEIESNAEILEAFKEIAVAIGILNEVREALWTTRNRLGPRDVVPAVKALKWQAITQEAVLGAIRATLEVPT